MKNVLHKLIRTEPYIRNLRDIAIGIYEYTASPVSADKAVERIEKYVEHLAANPKLGVVGKVEGTREIYPRGYRVIYEIKGAEVHILTVMHSWKNYP